MLPEGWIQRRLGDIFKFKNGLNGDSSLYGSGAKFVNVMDVFRGPRLRHHEIIGEMTATAKQLDEFGIKFGDVLFNRTSETDDEIAFATVYLDDKPAVFGGFVIRARPTDVCLTPEFCTYAFQSAFIRRSMIRLGQGAIRSNIGQGDLTTVAIKFPPIAEQRRIVEILSTWDRAIAVQERLVTNARAQKKALMQTLLTGKKRLPGFKGAWKMKLFKHVVSIDQDSLGQNTPPDFEFRYISLSDVSSGSIANNLPSHTFSEAPSRARRKLKLGDILMATVRPNLQAFARVQSAQSDCIASTGFSVLSAKRDHSADYVYHYLFGEHITGQIDALVVGSSYPAINSADVANLAIHCPEKAEQDAIALVLNVSDETIISDATKLSLLKREKSALMQQLLTGKRRVKVETIEP